MDLYLKRIILIFFLVAPLALLGCAAPTSTDYEKASSANDNGFQHTALSDDQYRVIFSGNRFTDEERVKNYALRHAAELTLAKGYRWFLVTEADHAVDIEEVTQTLPAEPLVKRPAHVSTPENIDKHCGLVACTATIYPQSEAITVTQLQTGGMTTSLNIRLGNEARPIDAYDAKEVLVALSENNTKAQINE
ncbi:hypothetical protein OE749_14540 [Aestuariibacter sp. AA17]|uniref:DUF4136 domain-containing protein n=1 Tax=Fluctibacter corallii TaxID=2984329 RepID=A0ABT3AB63_9ALTE|nr:hypothetical protein [Aestuariibacter sp. AA17]MCV2885914.1 hypothetical protein [Aestuariibacter sp. AA17]